MTMKYNPNWCYAEAPVSFIRLEERKVDDCPYDPDDLAWSYKMALRRLGRVRKSVKAKYDLSMRAMCWGCTDGGLMMWLIEVAHLTKNGDMDGSRKTSDGDLMKVMRELIPDHEEYHMHLPAQQLALLQSHSTPQNSCRNVNI